jgi:hypothetical protein
MPASITDQARTMALGYDDRLVQYMEYEFRSHAERGITA